MGLATEQYSRMPIGVGGPFIDRFSPREKEIFFLFCTGKQHREIAEILGISKFTVKKHIETARYKIGARTTTELVFLVMQDRLERQRQRHLVSITKIV